MSADVQQRTRALPAAHDVEQVAQRGLAVGRGLRHTLEAAGSSLDAVTQVLIYVTDRRYLATVNAVYAEYFQAPYPNRAAVVVAGLAREEMLVELVVYACL